MIKINFTKHIESYNFKSNKKLEIVFFNQPGCGFGVKICINTFHKNFNYKKFKGFRIRPHMNFSISFYNMEAYKLLRDNY